jgi:hydroxypyruvate reductase
MAESQYNSQPREFLETLYRTAVRQAYPAHALAAHLPQPPTRPGARTLVLGAGKAGGAMAQALEAAWPAQAALEGLVVTRYGHVPPRSPGAGVARIEIVEAAHPVPDAAGLHAAQRMLTMTQGLTKDDLVICLISGGGSSLLTLPAQWQGGGVSLEDKQRVNRELLASGATIAEINCVRKHLSAIKGGRLAEACAPARLVTLLISDVPGDDPAVIASGPTVPDPTTCAQALQILQRYGIAVASDLVQRLQRGELETPKPSLPAFAGNAVRLMATPQQSLEAAATTAREAGLHAYILSDEMEGESREVGRVHAALARAVALRGQPFARPCVILSGGETTVTLRTLATGVVKGRGGRAGEFCMGLTQSLKGQPGVYALAADTDGIDGLEDNAGVWVGPDSLERAEHRGLNITDYMDRNDAYGFFSGLGDLFITGPSYTNVNDFRAILIL